MLNQLYLHFTNLNFELFVRVLFWLLVKMLKDFTLVFLLYLVCGLDNKKLLIFRAAAKNALRWRNN